MTARAFDEQLVQAGMRSILLGIGEDPEREGLLKTPERVGRAYKELTAGYDKDPVQILSTDFSSDGYDEMVVLKDIDFYSLCEHHALNFFGTATVAYIPGDRVVGLSKLARLVDCFAKRLQIQERMTRQIAGALDEVLKPRGYGVVVKARHLCMCARGVGKHHSEMVTSALGGMIKDDPKARAEFLKIAHV